MILNFQGLEDEFFEVREATVDSIGELSMKSQDFAEVMTIIFK